MHVCFFVKFIQPNEEHFNPNSEFDTRESNSISKVKTAKTNTNVNENTNTSNDGNQSNVKVTPTLTSENRIYAYMHSECPLNRRELGRASWAWLHTLANYYPEKPSKQEKKEMNDLLWLYMKHYPCGYCSDMTVQEMYRNPPKLENRQEFAFWMCQIHNEVNQRLGKPEFDCKETQRRWRYGPADGSCSHAPKKRSSK